MKKRILSLLMVMAMAGSLMACGEKAAEPAAPETSDNNNETSVDPIANLIAATEGTVNIELWCSETEAYQTVMAGLVEEFKATYPEVDFNITIGGVSEADAKDRVLEDVEAAADVFVFADDQLTELVQAGALQSVDATFTYDPAATNLSSTVDAASKDGKLYAYPLTASNGYFLYYDSTVLSEADCASWESLTAAAEAAGKKVGMDMCNGWYVYGFFAGAGCNLTMNADGSNNCDWNSETGVAVAEAMSKIASQKSFVTLGDADAQAKIASADNDLVAYVSGTWDSNAFADAYGDGYAACKLPTFEVSGTPVQMGSYAGYKFVGVNAYAENTGWSMLLAEFLTSEKAQLAIGDATGEGPANTAAATQVSSPAIAALAAQADFADQQVVGGKFWDPAAALGKNITEGATNYQELLDTAVEGITQPAE